MLKSAEFYQELLSSQRQTQIAFISEKEQEAIAFLEQWTHEYLEQAVKNGENSIVLPIDGTYSRLGELLNLHRNVLKNQKVVELFFENMINKGFTVQKDLYTYTIGF